VEIVLVLLLSYFCGAIPFAYLFGLLFKGIDIRRVGDGNVGVKNVFRSVGPFPALLTLFGDVTKGALPILIGLYFGFAKTVIISCGFLAVMGHMWPIWLKFRGGKGQATILGIYLVLAFKELLLVAIIYVFLLFVLKKSSTLANHLSFHLIPGFAFLFGQSLSYVFGFVGFNLLRSIVDYKNLFQDIRSL
jgi:glycerol-3-phosphate acyltransferase PlsY